MSNLLSNAFQHGEGDVRLRAWEAETRDYVLIRIANAGRPIDASALQTLFEAFSHNSRPGGSLGLGLYIVDQIARAHGGECEVSSNERETVFTLKLPRIPLERVPDRG